MEEGEIKEFFRLYFKIDKLANKIFDEFERAKLLSASIGSPIYKRVEFDECDDNLVILYEDYYDDCYYDIIKIPFSVIYDNKVFEYIEKLKKEKEEILKCREQEYIKRQLEKEKEEYKRLKAKFEKDTNIEN